MFSARRLHYNRWVIPGHGFWAKYNQGRHDDGPKGVIMASTTAQRSIPRDPDTGSRKSAGARSMWSGSISFGMVSIPVRLFTATREHRVRFHLLKKDDHSRIQRKYVSSADDAAESVNNDELVRGYEISPNQFVIINKEELEALQPKESRTIDIAKFVDLQAIDPLYYDKPYYLAPGERAAKPYRLLVEAMRRSGKVGIAQFVMRKKEYLAALHALDNVICLYTMRFADEVVPADTLPGMDGDVNVSDKELKMATELIESLADKFNPDEFHDQYRQQVQEMIERKAKGEDIVTQAEPEERPHKVINLMAALQASLNEAKKSRRNGNGTNGNGHSNGNGNGHSNGHGPRATEHSETRRRKSA